MISNLMNKIWFSGYPHCECVNDNNGSKFKLQFEALCESFGIKHKPTSVKNLQANATLEQVQQVITRMLWAAELDIADTVVTCDIHVFLRDAAWAICSTYHSALKASPGEAVFGQDMMFDIPFLYDWKKLENTDNIQQT